MKRRKKTTTTMKASWNIQPLVEHRELNRRRTERKSSGLIAIVLAGRFEKAH